MATGKSIFVRIFGDNKDLKKSVNDSNTQLQNFGKSVAKIGTALGIAFGADQVIRFTAATVKLAASAEGVERAFNRIAYGGLLDELRKATAGTVSDLELMRKAVQAQNFKIPLEDLASLFEFAAKRAQDTGESVDYLVNSLVMGIGRKSLMVLDNLGISAVQLRQELGETGTEMATVGDYAAAVGRIAQDEMAKAGGVIEDTNVKLQQLKATWEGIKKSIGEKIMNPKEWMSSFGLSGAQGGGTDAEDYDKSLKKLRPLGEMEQRIALLAEMRKAEFEAAEASAEALKKEREEYDKLQKILVEVRLAKEALNDIDIELRASMNDSIESIKGTHEEFKSAVTPAKELTSSIFDFGLSLDEAEESIEEVDVDSLILKFDDLQASAKYLSDEIKRSMVNIASSFATGLGAASAGVGSFEELFADLASQVASALGDILIAFGLALGFPAGLPFIAIGLGSKFIGGAMGASPMGGQIQTGYSRQDQRGSSSSSRIYGNDIKTANDYATDLYNRVG